MEGGREWERRGGQGGKEEGKGEGRGREAVRGIERKRGR